MPARKAAIPRLPPAPGKQTDVVPDSNFLVRFDLGSRTFDTIGVFHTQWIRLTITRDDDLRLVSMEVPVNPLPLVDDWTVMSDGSVAVVRGRDYHVDWLGKDGRWTSSPKMPFTWEHLDDAQVRRHEREDRRLHRAAARRLEGHDRELGTVARHFLERCGRRFRRDQRRAVTEAPPRRRVPRATLCADERHLHRQLQREARREDLAEAIAFAAEGKVKAQIHKTKLDNINQVFSDLKAGKIDGRAVLMM